MKAVTEIRLSGFVLVLAAVIWIITEIMEIINGVFTPLQLGLTSISFMLIPYGLLGIHAVQSSRCRFLSFLGAVIGGLAFIVWSGVCIAEIVIEAQDETLFPTFTGGKIYYTTASLLTILGLLLLGISIIRARVFTVWIGYMLVIVLVLSAVLPLLGLSSVVLNGMAIVLSAIFIILGWSLMAGRYTMHEK